MRTVVDHVPYRYVRNPSTGRGVVLRVVHYAHVDQLSHSEIFNADVLDVHILDHVAISGIDGDGALIQHLRFSVVKDIDVLDRQAVHSLRAVRVSMSTDVDGMGDISPKA